MIRAGEDSYQWYLVHSPWGALVPLEGWGRCGRYGRCGKTAGNVDQHPLATMAFPHGFSFSVLVYPRPLIPALSWGWRWGIKSQECLAFFVTFKVHLPVHIKDFPVRNHEMYCRGWNHIFGLQSYSQLVVLQLEYSMNISSTYPIGYSWWYFAYIDITGIYPIGWQWYPFNHHFHGCIIQHMAVLSQLLQIEVKAIRSEAQKRGAEASQSQT